MNKLKNIKTKIVTHPIFGEGIIKNEKWDGQEVQVQFHCGLTLWLPARWLKSINLPNIRSNQISSKRLIEAFRLGIVPHQDVEFFTFCRGYEVNRLQKGLNSLKNGQGSVYIIEGSYGSGKTHLLEYIRHIALKYGYVTAYCELNNQETPLYRPKRVYRELVYNLRYIKDGSVYTFRDLLRQLSATNISDHCFFTPLFKHLRRLDNGDHQTEVFWQWIEGESTKDYATNIRSPFRVRGGQSIPALYDFSTAADFYCYIITGLSHLIRENDMGGLVIILDEVETIFHYRWNNTLFQRGLNFLAGLIYSAVNKKELKRINNTMLHNRVRPTPYIYGKPNILIILAITPVSAEPGLKNFNDITAERLILKKFSDSEFELIYDNLYNVYQTAYPGFKIDPEDRKKIFTAALKRTSGDLREFIKFSVATFDWRRLKHIFQS